MMSTPSVCFVGYLNLPILARGFEKHHTGGEEVQQTLLARALVRRGYRVSMVVADYGQQDGQQWNGITAYKTYAPNTGVPGLRYLHPRWTSLWSALKRADADVYYVSPAGAELGQVALFAAMHGRRVIFRSAHDSNCDPRTLMITYWRDRKLYEYGLRHADTILAQTEIQQQLIEKHYHLPSTVAVMMVEAPAHELPFDQRDIDVLWVNNLRRFKRPDLFVELAAAMPARRLHMVGGRISLHDVPPLCESCNGTAPDYHGAVPLNIHSRASQLLSAGLGARYAGGGIL
jgi:glycosyltransferase involved in cell wall biosynthesis